MSFHLEKCSKECKIRGVQFEQMGRNKSRETYGSITKEHFSAVINIVQRDIFGHELLEVNTLPSK